jgi:hypothetical protein
MGLSRQMVCLSRVMFVPLGMRDRRKLLIALAINVSRLAVPLSQPDIHPRISAHVRTCAHAYLHMHRLNIK